LQCYRNEIMPGVLPLQVRNMGGEYEYA